MTHFIRVLEFSDKEHALENFCRSFRSGESGSGIFSVDASTFKSLPSSAFAYWMSPSVGDAFGQLRNFAEHGLKAQVGCSTKDDFRFLRLWWELREPSDKWINLAKGGRYSPFYSDIHLQINWKNDAAELEAAILKKYPYLGDSANWVLHRESDYLKPGITWTRRTKSDFSPRFLPAGCIFSEKGLSAFVEDGRSNKISATLAVLSSSACRSLIEVQLAAADKSQAGGVANSYEVGIIKSTPSPEVGAEVTEHLAALACRAWRQKLTLDSIQESSHAFLLPGALRARLGSFDPPVIEAELVRVQAEIDSIAFDLYGFREEDRTLVRDSHAAAHANVGETDADDDGEDEESALATDQTESLLSWAMGVAFGRFDWRLATGERAAPYELNPFDPLPAISPGMLPDGAKPFHQHTGILIDDQGHPHDLARLVEQVLETVDAPVTEDVRRWLQKDFFAFHLKRYSKSRRKAPIYWPLATASGSYTLWLYYPSLSDQTLFTAVNDFVDPKLDDVRRDLQDLRDKGAGRSKQDEKHLEALASLEHELADLRDSLLEIAPNYRPDHDDGVQITAAPLWKLFRHKPWQKVLKDTWAKLEKGDYDWAHLAMNYWSQRVRDKCTTDKSLAIAHNLEYLYIEPEIAPKKARGRAKK
ncbi:type II restriction endonuclease subunit M [Pseudomonas sp. Choline-3u-10]|uniref:type II restriction endonuclease subunit M n=1 Tax=Pseudomonas sp. Choline-3u-10 TaxID=2058311 RepID=UPI000C31E05A|nr:type II restriction endonuclease subunit M [Pseudomonas sp. Choline-3u-10]PKG96286.1 type II restriction endonuclease subunit M [Pseudomonas sp. Choline-3u-10]